MDQDPRIRLVPGKPCPLGAHWDGQGVNFALLAPAAEGVSLCLFDEAGMQEVARLALVRSEEGIWCGYMPGAEPGLIYGYRVSGAFSPEDGRRFNDRKLLLDPYARQVVGRYDGQDAFIDTSDDDTASIALKGRVCHDHYDWEGDVSLRVPIDEMIVYELHVRGFTRRHPDVPEALRGTYAALAEPVVLDYLEKLGVTSIELLPVFAIADEPRLLASGKVNYWGYNTIGFFAPENRYWSGRCGTTPVSEFKDMVKALHRRGFEVILDVVYNHTAEGDETGPTLSFRGIDNAMYYRLQANDPARYENWTGCGNCLNLAHPHVRHLVMDSLRYWVEEMHVDGFRFDLAPILAREPEAYSISSAFFQAMADDPVLSHVKRIAEPWDLGPDGYQLGHFPAGWQEWNDRYRDTVRAFWLHRDVPLSAFAQRFAGSADLFGVSQRWPFASINYVTSHDGFSLHDLVSYNHKHNDANGEDNRDGTDRNFSWNAGEEGASMTPEVLSRRQCLKRALLMTVLFSQGTPMLVAGDEFGQTQQGNNNPYCQDNDMTWLNWQQADPVLQEFVAYLVSVRKMYPALRSHLGTAQTGAFGTEGSGSIRWLSPYGGEMTAQAWENAAFLCVGAMLDAGDIPCLLLFNASMQSAVFRLPYGRWRVQADSSGRVAVGTCLEFQAILPGSAMMLVVPSQSC